MTKLILLFLVMVSLFLLASCKTYYIPVDSFKQQFAGKSASREVTTRGPMGGDVTYKTYPIDYIDCVDKKGNPQKLKNGPSIEIRFTDTNNKRTTFYFDLITTDGTYVHGVKSRFITSITKTIPVNSIKKIEVQDGRKKFRYVN